MQPVPARKAGVAWQLMVPDVSFINGVCHHCRVRVDASLGSLVTGKPESMLQAL